MSLLAIQKDVCKVVHPQSIGCWCEATPISSICLSHPPVCLRLQANSSQNLSYDVIPIQTAEGLYNSEEREYRRSKVKDDYTEKREHVANM